MIAIFSLFNSKEITEVKADTKLNCQNTLSYQDRNEQVKILQKLLNQAINCNLAVDGIFGNKTFQCVTKFQDKYDLAVDGIVGIKTCTKLNSLIKKNKTFNGNYIIVSARRLNVRANATKTSKVLDIVNSGSVFKIYGSKKVNRTTWYKIKVDNKYGYVSGDYVEKDAIVLSILSQNLQLYKNGEKIMEAPVITGNKGNHDTPVGHYQLKVQNLQKARTLRGTNDDGSKYNAYVDYWLPFITSRGIGFHDASWRDISEYNTETYQTNGSHGCVNMQKKDAETLYNEITEDIDVFVID